MFILLKGHQPGVYVPLRALFLVVNDLILQGYLKVPEFWYAKKLCCNLPKIQTKRPNLRIFFQNDANGIANSEDPDRTAQSD